MVIKKNSAIFTATPIPSPKKHVPAPVLSLVFALLLFLAIVLGASVYVHGLPTNSHVSLGAHSRN